jgi:hypothetical protein
MQGASTMTSLVRRKIGWLLFAATFFAYGYFYQGGGWAQNARFAMVRALVEEGHYWIDDHLIYTRTETASNTTTLARVRVSNATIKTGGVNYALTWTDAATGRDKFIGNQIDSNAKPVHIESVAVSGDLAYARGHFYPSKAPGASLLAAVPYFIIYRLERLFGANPDDWRTLTCNAWLTSVFTEGLLSAIGCVLVFRLALGFSAGKTVPSVLTAIAFAFGTMFFPLATLLQDQNIAAVLLVASFYLLHRVKEEGRGAGTIDRNAGNPSGSRMILSGLFTGFAAITSYVPAVAAVALAVYLVWGLRRRDGVKWFGLGLAGPLVLFCGYNLACFGRVFTTSYHYVNIAMRHSNGAIAGTLMIPRWDVLLTVLLSPFRGLFFSAPVLLMGAYGLFTLFRSARWRAEACLFVFLVGLYLWFNASFWSWHGGWIAVPRYLGPAVPFLAVPMVFGFIRFPKTTNALTIVSVAINLLFTAVDPQVPTEFDAAVNAPTWSQWRHAPLCEYTLPMFLTGRAGPFLNRQLEKTLGEYAARLDAEGTAPQERDRLLAAKRQEWSLAIEERRMPGSNGPVSGNPTGVYESWFHSLFAAASQQTEWNSFNVGEFIFQQSRLSLLPLAVVCGGLLAWALTVAGRARRADVSSG